MTYIQQQKSFEKHPNLKKWFLCTPTNFTPDKTIKNRNVKSELTWFKDTLPTCLPKNHFVKLVHWGDSDFNHWLSESRFIGKLHYFFGELDLNLEWFNHQFRRELTGIGRKFEPILHVKSSVEAEIHDYLCDGIFVKDLTKIHEKLLAEFKRLKNSYTTFTRSEARNIENPKDFIVLISVKITHKGLFLYSVLSAFFSDILISDLKQVLPVNSSNKDFIFSDNPVICYNLVFYKKKTGFKGLQSPGILIFCPIDNCHVIALYDYTLYEFLPVNSDRIIIHDRNDVKAINALQYFACFNNVYFTNNQNLQQIVIMYREFKNSIGNRKKIFAPINNITFRTGNTSKEIEGLRFSTFSMNYNLSTSFIKIKKPLPKTIPHYRDIRLVNLFKKSLKDYISAID